MVQTFTSYSSTCFYGDHLLYFAVVWYILHNASPDFHSKNVTLFYSMSQSGSVVPAAFNDAKTKQIVLTELISGCEFLRDYTVWGG